MSDAVAPAAEVGVGRADRISAAPPDLFSKRLLVVTGKGGVGKSTVSALLALLAARRGKRVLLAQSGSTRPGDRLLGGAPPGPEIAEVLPNLFAVRLEAEAAMREYATGVLHSRWLYRLIFENPRVHALLDALPGLAELVVIGKVRYHVEEVDRAGRPRWDLVVLDTPATGGGVFLLSLPQRLLEVFDSGPLASYARRQRALLADAERTSVQLVTLAEELPVRETIDLAAVLGRDLGMPLGYVFVNALHAPLLDDREREVLSLLERGAAVVEPRARPLFDAAHAELDHWEAQESHLAELRRALPLPCVALPLLHARALGRHELELLTRAAGQQLEAMRLTTP